MVNIPISDVCESPMIVTRKVEPGSARHSFPYVTLAMAGLIAYLTIGYVRSQWTVGNAAVAINLWVIGGWMAVAGAVRLRGKRRLACALLIACYLMFANAGNLLGVTLDIGIMRR